MVGEMCRLIAHRGPDGEGIALFDDEGAWVSPGGALDRPRARVGLGHRRLAIIDTSAAGCQPMSDPGGRFWIVYNGEVYNHVELRTELEALGHVFITHSDTEVLLAAWHHWGADCLPRLNGMFAFVLYDRSTDRLTVVRDRLGVKPLYWWRAPDGTLAFASEVKTFTVLPGWRARLNGQRAYDFLNWGLTDHTAETLFADVHQVPAGGMVEDDLTTFGECMRPIQWYTPKPAATVPATFDEAAEAYRELFLDSVRLRLRADVPVGTALSGGLDSSSVVCAVHRLLGDNQVGARNAFSSRSHDPRFDEGVYMDAVTRQTGVVHHCTWPAGDGFLADLDKMVWHLDEPFGGGSIYAQWLVFAKVAQTPVKVTLDGHGADEILAGYTAYVGPQFGALVRGLKLRRLVEEWQAQRGLHGRSAYWLLGMAADDLLPATVRGMLRRLSGRTEFTPPWLDCARLGATPHDPFEDAGARGRGILGFSLAQLTAVSLPMQLKWFDRDSMAHSIESREPFLDHRLVEFALGLPDEWKLSQGISKRVVRAGMTGILPAEIICRRDKMGFATPESVWVTQDVPEGFQDALDTAIAQSEGILTPHAREEGLAMTEGALPFHNRLIRQIVFGYWMRRFGVERSA